MERNMQDQNTMASGSAWQRARKETRDSGNMIVLHYVEEDSFRRAGLTECARKTTPANYSDANPARPHDR